MSKVIQVQNLSKKYLISSEQKGSYSTIVDTLSQSTKRFFKKVGKPFQKKKELYEEFWALQDINFEVEQGDRLAILGKNGAGKSTLLKILSRITEPTTGSFRIKGKVSSLLEVGTGFHPELTGRENIFLNGTVLGMQRQEIQKKFDEIVAFSEMEKFLDTPIKYYSSGMYARLGFAISAHLDPDILIVDEVLAVGDAQFQEKCLTKLDKISKSGRTIIFVSHSAAAMMHLCNKGILLERGKIKSYGKIESCVNEYVSTYRINNIAWEGNLGDDYLRVTKAYLTSASHQNDIFYQNEKLTLNIECQLNQPLQANTFFGFQIKNTRDHVVAHSYLSKQGLNAMASPGKYTLNFDLDASCFWEGEYTVFISYFIPHKCLILYGEIQLKFPLYAASQDESYVDQSSLDGIILDDTWQISPFLTSPTPNLTSLIETANKEKHSVPTT